MQRFTTQIGGYDDVRNFSLHHRGGPIIFSQDCNLRIHVKWYWGGPLETKGNGLFDDQLVQQSGHQTLAATLIDVSPRRMEVCKMQLHLMLLEVLMPGYMNPVNQLKWSQIASKLPGRTDNEIKNYWHTHLKKNATRSLQSIAILTHKNSENSDQMVATTDSMNVIESTALDSFLEVISFENLDSMDSIEVDFGEILRDPFSFSTSNDLNTSQSIQI